MTVDPSIITTGATATAWHPDVFSFAPSEAIPDALILSQTTVATKAVGGDDVVTRVAYVNDASATTFSNEGDEIDPVAPSLSEVVIGTGKLSLLVRVSREQFEQLSTSENLSDSVRRTLTRGADHAFLNQTPPVAPDVWPPAGILHDTDIIEGDPVVADLDPLVDLLAEVESNGATPTSILVDPLAWAALQRIKTATGAATPLLGAGTTATERMLLGVPVVVSNAMPANTGLVNDKSAVVSAVGTVNIANSEHAFFAADSVAIRGTFRFGARVMHPDRLGLFTVGTPAP